MSETKSKPSTTDSRVRNFATVVYPESAPDGWKETITQSHVACFISPLHDKDVNPGGEPKKPHYHVLVMYEGKKSVLQVKELFDQIGGVGLEVVQSVRGYSRYLCHLDNPEKAQYKQDEVTCLSGADYASVIGLSLDKYRALAEMEDFCERYGVKSYSLLSKYARMHRTDWYRILCDCGSVHMREYVKSFKWSEEQGYLHIIDPDTGDVLI